MGQVLLQHNTTGFNDIWRRFPRKITTLFSDYNDVIAYIDNILHTIKSSLEQHVQRLEQILIILR